MVAAPLLDSSSGCACTAISRSGPRCGGWAGSAAAASCWRPFAAGSLRLAGTTVSPRHLGCVGVAVIVARQRAGTGGSFPPRRAVAGPHLGRTGHIAGPVPAAARWRFPQGRTPFVDRALAPGLLTVTAQPLRLVSLNRYPGGATLLPYPSHKGPSTAPAGCTPALAGKEYP